MQDVCDNVLFNVFATYGYGLDDKEKLKRNVYVLVTYFRIRYMQVVVRQHKDQSLRYFPGKGKGS